jgi:hypothetical protein
MKIDNKSFERVEQFKYFLRTLTNRNAIHEEIKSGLKPGIACYHSVQDLLSYSLLSTNIKIKLYRTTNLPVVLYGCENWSLTLREEYWQRMFENRVLREMLGPKKDEVTGEWELYDLYASPNIIRVIISRVMSGARHVAHMVASRGAYRILVGKPERKRPLFSSHLSLA